MGTTITDKKFWTYKNSSYNEVLPAIEELREKYQGNYDGMFGVISNFSWTFEADGSYNIKLEIITQGDVIESLKANLPKTTGDDNINPYAQLTLDRVKENPAQNQTEFYDLYPGLEQIITDWFNKTLIGNSDFSTSINPQFTVNNGSAVKDAAVGVANFALDQTVRSLSSGFISLEGDTILPPNNNFPQLDLKSYVSLNQNNPQVNEININQALELDSRFTFILNNILINLSEGNVQKENKEFTSLDYQGKSEDLKILEDKSINSSIDNYLGWNAGYSSSIDIFNMVTSYSYTYYSVQSSFRKFEKLNGITKGEITDGDKEKVKRMWFARNVGLNNILLFVFQDYRSENMAGGPKDAQFETPEPETPEEEAKQEQEDEDQEIINDLLSKRNKNKVFSYLYDVRNCWNEGEAGKPWVPFDGKFSGPIQLLGKEIGNIINPTSPDITSGTKEWNNKVRFPIYPRTTTTPKEIEDEIKLDFNLKELKFNLIKTKITDFGDIDSNQPNAADFIKLDLTPINKQHFIRLGVFLQFLEQKVIPKIETGSQEGQPMLLIDYHPENNICYTIDNVISLNPNKIIVENSNFHLGGGKYKKVFPQIKRFVNSLYQKRENGVWGNIMNIYINFARIEELFEDVDDKNQVSVFSILKNISTDINESLGNINNIEPIIDKETNTIKFIDQTSIPKLDQIATSLGIPNFNKKSGVKLEIFGYNTGTNQSNFVRSAGITTEISKNYATMITIGATANGSIPGAEATAFSKWNNGISDRFKEDIIDADVKGNIEEQNKSIKQRYANSIVRNFQPFGLTKTAEGKYFIDDDLISINKDIISDFYIFAQAETSKDNEENESSIGFLPFNLKLSMDGLSGIKIYNKVNVNTSFLPTNYGETLSFIITGVNHKLSGNEWVTNLDTIATSKNKQTK
jgi:hypothetical protein